LVSRSFFPTVGENEASYRGRQREPGLN
jgi:hypothetical protein